MSEPAPFAARLRAVLPPPEAEWREDEAMALAAVLVPLCVDEAASGDDAHVLFIRRRAGLRHHAGQYAFPGGRREGDETPVACALREFEEELGLPAAGVDVLGALPPRASLLGYLVHPVVGRLPTFDGMRPHPAEVDLAFTVPWSSLADEGRWHWRTVPSPQGTRTSPFFTFDEHVVWGLTARVARDLLESVR